jgi:predicted nucleotidyltransferase
VSRTWAKSGCPLAHTSVVIAKYTELIARGEADPDVGGLILSGSVARGMATAYSDADVYVVVSQSGERWKTSRTSELDTIVISVEQLADVSDRWQRYSYRGARVLLDRLDGRVAALVRAQASLTSAEVQAWVREQLDGYINFVYRGEEPA